MASIIRLCPLSGGAGEETPHCYVLEVDQFTFLLDCGWDPNFSQDIVVQLKKYAHKIDAVLLSHPDILHIGLLPYAVNKLGLSCPIFATGAVHKMGEMFLYDLYQSRRNMEDFDLFTLDDVDKTTKIITDLRYNETYKFTGKGAGLAITALEAGHLIGGAMWRIVKEGEEDIIYAVDVNPKREKHLRGALKSIETISRPSLLITDAYNAEYKSISLKDRHALLAETITDTLRGGGNCLICVDTAGRVLELALLLESVWPKKDSGLIAYSLALLNNVSTTTIENAKSQIEWMSDKLMRSFEGNRNNPFTLKYVKLCHSMKEVEKVPSPKVVLASTPDMECGYSRELFAQWCSNGKNSVILTSRTPEGTLAHDLIKKGGNRSIKLTLGKRVKLTGYELQEFKRKEKEKQKSTDLEDLESSSDEEMEVTISSSTKPIDKKPVKHDIIMKASGENEPKRHFFKSNKSKYPMYPLHEEKIRWDDYGEIIRPEDWMDTSMATNTDPNDDPNAPGFNGMIVPDDSYDVTEAPTKCTKETLTLNIKAQIRFIDLEGRSDGDTVLKLIENVKPRRVIVVRGSAKNCQKMEEKAIEVTKETGMASDAKKVFLPKTGELVDATTESFIYQVRLPDSLMSLLNFQHAKDNAFLAWVDGKLSYAADEVMDIEETPKEEDPIKSLVPTLHPMLPQELKETGHPTSFVNELKLSDFKMVLARHNIASEFSGGVLFCCNGKVALRRHDSGRVTIEGCVSEEYYQVRELLYQQYAII